MYKLMTRSFQAVARPVANALDWREPKLLIGKNRFKNLSNDLVKQGIARLLIVTDEGIEDSGLLEVLIDSLKEKEIAYTIYNKVKPNPTIEICEEIAIEYNFFQAEAMLAIGGGSVLDAAKAAGIVVIKPEKPLKSFRGLMKVREHTPFLIAVPTTAGTGSEGTLAAVISDTQNREKITIMDTNLIPNIAVLDASLTKTLPKPLIAGPGMDTLVHAVEAFIGRSNTEQTERYAREAIQLVSDNLIEAYNNKENDDARENMLKASYYAGRAFHRAYVGYAHAMSHALSAYYNLPHGQTNATILPIILRLYGDAIHKDLAELAGCAGVAKKENTEEDNAELFIQTIEDWNNYMDIPSYISEIKEEDIADLAKHAEKEANPLYPVPVIFNEQDLVDAFKKVSGNSNE